MEKQISNEKNKYFKSLTVKKLKSLLGQVKISKQGNKSILIQKLINNFHLFDNQTQSDFKIEKSSVIITPSDEDKCKYLCMIGSIDCT